MLQTLQKIKINRLIINFNKCTIILKILIIQMKNKNNMKKIILIFKNHLAKMRQKITKKVIFTKIFFYLFTN